MDATILYLNNYSGPGLGGGEVHMRSLVLAARDAGARVVVACAPGSDVEAEFRQLGVEVEPIRLRISDLPGAARHVRGIAQRVGADIIHSNGWLTNVVARLAREDEGARVLNSVLVDPDAPSLSGASRIEQVARNVLDRRTLRRADAIAPITQAVAEKLASLGAEPGRMHVIPGSVDAEALRAQAASAPPGFRRADDSVYVGAVGRLETVKGMDTFVRAAAGLNTAGVRARDGACDVRFVLGGAGSQEGELREIAVAHELSERFEFLGPVVSTAATFAALDIVVVPSRSEGFGIVACEAMALGKPVVATRAGGLPEVVEDGVTGVLVDPDDSTALALAIELLLDDPSAMAAMGAAGVERVEREFSREQMSSAYLSLYSELLERPS